METLAEQLRKEILLMAGMNRRSFLERRAYVANKIRGGEREVFFSLAKGYGNFLKRPTRKMLDNIGVEKDYRVKTWEEGLDGEGIFYRNGRHYIKVVKQTESFPHKTIDEKEYCVEDEDGFWMIDHVYNRSELLDLGAYLENEGFNVYVNRCSDRYSRYPYKTYFFNIDCLIVSL